MNRNDSFEKIKITKASTNKVVLNVYFDAFGIEKVRFQNANYNDKSSIDCYLGFEDVALIATDAASGRLIKKLEAGEKVQFMTGSKSSKNYDGAPESRILSFGLSTNGKGEKTVFVNMSRGKGKLTDTGAIQPDGAPDIKIGVPMSVDKFRSVMIYTYDWIKAYLARFTNNLVKEAEAERLARKNSNE